MKQLLDTNIVLYFLGGKLEKSLPKGDFYISVITEMVLLSYPGLDEKVEKEIRMFIASLTVIELESAIKDIAIRLRRAMNLKLPDAVIAATALFLEAKLISNDARLSRIPDLKCEKLALAE